MNTLDICKQTRKIASNSLYIVLEKLLRSDEPISEVMLRNRWLEELQKHDQLFADGWYIPPPYGIGVLFATDSNVDRVKFKSLRNEEYWPRDDIYLDTKNGFAMFYCSPVHKKTGIIGDFGMNIYFGNNTEIHNVLKKLLSTIQTIFNKAKIGMKLSDIHKIAKKEIEASGFTNEWWTSTTDFTGTNYGHSIPGLSPQWSREDLHVFQKQPYDWKEITTTINTNRKFVNKYESTRIEPGIAFTIEPRALAKDTPTLTTIYFHTIAIFRENGEKELLTNFDELFKLIGMSYMLL